MTMYAEDPMDLQSLTSTPDKSQHVFRFLSPVLLEYSLTNFTQKLCEQTLQLCSIKKIAIYYADQSNTAQLVYQEGFPNIAHDITHLLPITSALGILTTKKNLSSSSTKVLRESQELLGEAFSVLLPIGPTSHPVGFMVLDKMYPEMEGSPITQQLQNYLQLIAPLLTEKWHYQHLEERQKSLDTVYDVIRHVKAYAQLDTCLSQLALLLSRAFSIKYAVFAKYANDNVCTLPAGDIGISSVGWEWTISEAEKLSLNSGNVAMIETPSTLSFLQYENQKMLILPVGETPSPFAFLIFSTHPNEVWEIQHPHFIQSMRRIQSVITPYILLSQKQEQDKQQAQTPYTATYQKIEDWFEQAKQYQSQLRFLYLKLRHPNSPAQALQTDRLIQFEACIQDIQLHLKEHHHLLRYSALSVILALAEPSSSELEILNDRIDAAVQKHMDVPHHKSMVKKNIAYPKDITSAPELLCFLE